MARWETGNPAEVIPYKGQACLQGRSSGCAFPSGLASVCAPHLEESTRIGSQEHRYHFDHVFDEDTTQAKDSESIG